jgi:hypothetical protein
MSIARPSCDKGFKVHDVLLNVKVQRRSDCLLHVKTSCDMFHHYLSLMGGLFGLLIGTHAIILPAEIVNE